MERLFAGEAPPSISRRHLENPSIHPFGKSFEMSCQCLKIGESTRLGRGHEGPMADASQGRAHSASLPPTRVDRNRRQVGRWFRGILEASEKASGLFSDPAVAQCGIDDQGQPRRLGIRPGRNSVQGG